jgi:PilZ domain
MDLLPAHQETMSDSSTERRATRRFDMRLPATVKTTGTLDETRTETQNVSARGVFFYLDRPVDPGSHLEVTLTFPPHITLTDPVRIRFLARVLRIDTAPVSRVGVAAFIEEYEFLRANPATNRLSDLENSN